MNNSTLRSTLITLTSFIFVITAVNAWTGPSVSAPDGNVSAPLTISATSQSKTGGLDVGWLSAVGAVKVGYTATACSADLAGSLRWNTGVMEYCNGTVWGPFGGSGEVRATKVTYDLGADCNGVYCNANAGYNNINYNKICEVKGANIAADYIVFNLSYPVSVSQWTGSSWSEASDGTQITRISCWKFSSGGTPAVESDPTVLASVKDGVSWAEVTGKPDLALSSGSVVAGCEWASQANPSYCWGGASQQSSEPVVGLCPSGTRIRKMAEAGMGLSFLCIKN